jgi:hypothetical protein
MEHLFLRRTEKPYPAWFCRLVDDMFAITQHWQPSAAGPSRGRLFESVFHRYCDFRQLPVTERPGSRTIRHERAASGFSHESDGVLSFPDLTVHLELKHLSVPLGKNDLLIFNQKGLDHLLGGSSTFRRLPFYRVVLSGHILSQEARRFAVQWGIIVVEPDRLPLITLHGLAGRVVPRLRAVSIEIQDEIWSEVPHLLSSLQKKVRLFSQLLAGDRRCISDYRLDRAIDFLQRVVGDQYWMALDMDNPCWLEQHYNVLSAALNLESSTRRSLADDRTHSKNPLEGDATARRTQVSTVP